MEFQMYSAEYSIRLLEAEVHINRLIYYPQKSDTEYHLHSYLELHYNTEGSTLFQLNFHDSLELNPEEWLLLGKNVYHEEMMTSACGGYCLGIEIRAAEADSPLIALQNMTCYKSGIDPAAGALIRNILQEAAEKKVGYEDCCRNLFALLLIHILRSCPEQTPAKTHRELTHENIFIIIDGFFNRVFHYEGQNLTINDLAAELHVSSRHVSRILREHYGTTFSEMLLATKIKFTEYLLKHTDKSITEISEICGFTNTYLIRSFKKVHQITPAQYRKSYRKDMV